MSLLQHNLSDFSRSEAPAARRLRRWVARLVPAVGLGALLAASACEFDSTQNPAFGCDGCQLPNHCIDGFCVRGAAPAPAPASDAGPTGSDAASGATCQPGTTELCYDGPAGSDENPPCRFGRKTCAPDGTLGECRGQIIPVEEACNELDDDCDGMTDEQLTRDARVCVGGRFVCDAPSMSVPELCDGTDNDCDGATDEDFDFESDVQHCGGCGIVCAENETCCDGGCTDLASDGLHCGACGIQCKRATTCCAGGCVDTTTDANHCGKCGERCEGAMSCCDSVCLDAETDRDHCGPFCLNCAAGEACCFGACANLDSFQHCGSCERVCNAGELCCAGDCSTQVCQ